MIMDTLCIPLTNIGEGGIPIDTTVDSEELRPEGAKSLPAGAVRVRGTLWQAGDAYLFQGVVSGEFEEPCDRCLEHTRLPFAIDALWTFSETALSIEPEGHVDVTDPYYGDEDGEVSLIHGAEIEMAPHVWEELVLAYPSKFLCKQDCVGLCEHCGANLNEGPCDCQTDAYTNNNSGLAELANLYPDLRPKAAEE